MKLSGWIFMILSWSLIIALMVFSYRKILQKPVPEEKKPPKKSAH